MLKRFKIWCLSALVAAGFVVPMVALAPTASAYNCAPTWVVGVGGFNGGWQDSLYIVANEHVQYDSNNAIAGLDRLRFIMNVHREVCPNDHIKMVGHSQGAGIVHQWVEENQWYPNANAILLADPKMHEWPGGDGFSRELWWMGYPMAGNDDWFGNFPTATLCQWRDHICRADSDWNGYFSGVHTWYDFNGFNYGNWEDGAVYFYD